MKKKLLLIDGSNLIFRAYYATEKQNIQNLDDRPAGAIYGLIGMLAKIFEKVEPTHVFIALDTGKSTFRHEMYEDYKGKRTETPAKLKEQFPEALRLYEAMGIKFCGTDSYEADDLIATYAAMGKEKDFEVKVVSGDKDLLQLIEPNVNVITPAIGFHKEIDYDEAIFIEKYLFEPNRFIEYKALVGDTSDNIIGVAKVGDKTAKKLILEYKTIEEIIEAAKSGEIKGKIGENIAASADQIYENLKLVTLIKDVDMELPITDLEFKMDYQKLVKFSREYGFQKYVSQYSQYLEDDDEVNALEIPEIKLIEEFKQEIHVDLEGQNSVFFQTLKENYLESEKLGFGISSIKGNFYLPQELVNDEFKEFVKNEKIDKITYDLKRMAVANSELKFNGFTTDLKLAITLLNPTNYKLAFDSQLAKYGVEFLKYHTDVYKQKANPKKPDPKVLAEDIGLKAVALRVSQEKINKLIEENNLTGVLYEIEMPLSEVLITMEQDGIYIDQQNLKELHTKYDLKQQEIVEKIKEFTDVNINSPAQLSAFLFDSEQLNLPLQGLKKTSGKKISTDVDNLTMLLEKLEGDPSQKEAKEFIENLLEYRKYTKLKTTYVEAIQGYVDKDSRIHPIFHQLQSETGRISTQDPSIQNIPIKTELGQAIRGIFAAPPGRKIIALDYSQIELRVMAEISGDKNLIKAFKEAKDIHEQTAIAIFGHDNLKENRSRAKAINFGIIYGMSSYGLASRVNITTSEAKEFIEKYFATYPKIKDYLDNQIISAQEKGYVETIMHRKRIIENINSGSYQEKEHAKRVAINTPVQGTAADLIKLAMIKINDEILKDNNELKMVMQIHDELVFEVDESEVEKYLGEIKKIMETVLKLKVPLVADGSIGNNWLEAK